MESAWEEEQEEGASSVELFVVAAVKARLNGGRGLVSYLWSENRGRCMDNVSYPMYINRL